MDRIISYLPIKPLWPVWTVLPLDRCIRIRYPAGVNGCTGMNADAVHGSGYQDAEHCMHQPAGPGATLARERLTLTPSWQGQGRARLSHW